MGGDAGNQRRGVEEMEREKQVKGDTECAWPEWSPECLARQGKLTSVIPAFKSLKQEDYEFKTSLGHTAWAPRPCMKQR